MARRSQIELVAKALVLLLQRRSFSQAEAARVLGVQTKTARKLLEALRDADPRIERYDDPPHVFWSVPKTWLPALHTLLSAEDTRLVARLLSRHPKSAARDHALERLFGERMFGSNTKPVTPDEAILAALEDGERQRVAVLVRYLSKSRGEVSPRTLSIQRIQYGSIIRLYAWCHDRNRLLPFRADRVQAARLEPSSPFVAVPEAEVTAFIERGVDGYSGDGPPVECVFWVRDPEARWVRDAEPFSAFTIEAVDSGIRVRALVNAVERLARDVVGLGDAVLVETPLLRQHVRQLAAGALQASVPVMRKGAGRSAVAKWRTR